MKRYDTITAAMLLGIVLVFLLLMFVIDGHAKQKKAQFYLNTASIDGIRVLECGPMVNRVRECKVKIHFKDDSVSIKPTKTDIPQASITAESE